MTTGIEEGIVLAKLARQGVRGVKLLEKYLDPTSNFIMKRDQLDIEWWGEVWDEFRRAAQERQTMKEKQDLLERLTEDQAALGVLAKYFDEAHSEPLEERRRMLAFAAAGLANLDLKVAELARVQRVVRELDPEDIIALYKTWLIPTHSPSSEHQKVYKVRQTPELLLRFWEETGAESLDSSGCVRIYSIGGAGIAGTEQLRVTKTGVTVLSALRGYLAATALDLSGVPGHEMTPEFRSRDEADALIATVPGLIDLLLTERPGPFRSNAHYTGCNVITGAAANGKGTLHLWLSQERGRELQRIAGKREEVEQQKPVAGIFVDRIGASPDDNGVVSVQLSGPHDVMRFLAYELFVYWS